MNNDFSDVLPRLLPVLDDGITPAAVRAVADTAGWTVTESIDQPKGLSVEIPGFQCFAYLRDPTFVDHVRLWRCASEVDALFDSVRTALEAEIGLPTREGRWPASPGDPTEFEARFAVWCRAAGQVVLQQDDLENRDFPELSGLEVDVCLVSPVAVDDRTWRLRGRWR